MQISKKKKKNTDYIESKKSAKTETLPKTEHIYRERERKKGSSSELKANKYSWGWFL